MDKYNSEQYSWSMNQKKDYLQKHGRAIIREARRFAVPSNGLVLFHLSITVLCYLFFFSSAYWVFTNFGFLLALPCIVITAIWIPRFVGTQHDCGHRSYLKNKKIENYIGMFCSVITLLPYKCWGGEHSFHHVHNNKIETNDIGDIKTISVNRYRNLPEHAKKKYRDFRNPWNLIIWGGFKYVFILNRFFRHNNIQEFHKYRKSVIYTNVILILLYGGLTYFLGIKFIIICFSIWFIYGMNDVWFFYVQHQFEEAVKYYKKDWDFIEAALLGSSRYKLPWLLNFTTTNIGEHPLHHLMASMPHYRLRKAWKKILEKFPDLKYIVTEITLLESFKCAQLALYDSEKQKMISFKEFERKY